jgi:hypothetical protein
MWLRVTPQATGWEGEHGQEDEIDTGKKEKRAAIYL